jgi:hypothetical protein
MKFNSLKIITILLSLISVLNVSGQNTWTFVSSPDWHLAERELDPPVKPEDINLQLISLKDMKRYNPELFLMAGDMANGLWIGEEWIARFAPGGTQEDAIINIGKIAYGNLKKRLEENGFDKFIVTIGDHELGDDSVWQPGSQYSYFLPVFRDAFQRVWNRDEQGNFLYSEPIGTAESRPMNTPWENTSFAYKYRNVLFVSVDIFDQPDPDQPVGYQKLSVYANMSQEHLQWFENVLKEAKKDPEIKHIIVQAHTPVLSPVRGQRTSMLYCEDMEESAFWKVMQKYEVDLYFAGEVHAPSAQRNKNKFPIQVVHGIAGINYLTVEVSDSKLHLRLRELDGKDFSTVGEMIIDKSFKKTRVNDSGVLKIINTEEPLIHYTFDEKELIGTNPPLGFGMGYLALNPPKHLEVPNIAQMGRYYNLQTEALLVDGIKGKAIQMNGSEIAECQGSGPMTKNHSLTFIVWVKTTQENASCIASHGGGKGNFDIGLKDGGLVVFAGNSYLKTTNSGKINNKKWHQVAVVLPNKGKNLRDVKLYIDGVKQKTQLIGDNHPIMIRPSYQMKLGSSSSNERLGLQNFIGYIDELIICYKPLSSKMIKQEFRKMNVKQN